MIPCSTAAFPRNRWRRVRVDLPHGLGDGSAPLRFDPGNETGVIQIARIQVRMATNQLIWRARGVAELAQLVVGGTAVVVPDERVFRILNYGIDPQVLLPWIDAASGSTLKLEIWLRLDIGPETVAECFAALQSRQRAALAKREAQLRETEQQRAALENNLRSFEEQRLSLEVALDEHQAELAAHRSELERLEREVWENRVRRADFAARLKEREKWITELQESLVWKAAKPLWKAERHLSRRKAATPEPAADEIVFALDGPGVRRELAHHHPQQLQVVTEKNRPAVGCGGVQISFIARGNARTMVGHAETDAIALPACRDHDVGRHAIDFRRTGTGVFDGVVDEIGERLTHQFSIALERGRLLGLACGERQLLQPCGDEPELRGSHIFFGFVKLLPCEQPLCDRVGQLQAQHGIQLRRLRRRRRVSIKEK